MYAKCLSFCWEITIYGICIVSMKSQEMLARPSTHYTCICFSCGLILTNLLVNVTNYFGAPLRRDLRPPQSLSVKMCGNMLTSLRLLEMIIHINYFTQHTYCITAMKQTLYGRSDEVGNLLVSLLLAGPPSHTDISLWVPDRKHFDIVYIYVYKQDNYVYMQDDYVYMYRWFGIHVYLIMYACIDNYVYTYK